jgi:hypothetical protein
MSTNQIRQYLDLLNEAETSSTFRGTLVANEPVIPGQPLSPIQMSMVDLGRSMGNQPRPEVQAAYDMAKKAGIKPGPGVTVTPGSGSEPRCAMCGTPQSQHQELKHQFVAGGAADRPVPVAQGGGEGVGRVKQLQAELKAAGAELGATGANRDGIDGDIGPLTTAAMDKYPDIAAKYPDLSGSPLAQAATPAVDISKLNAALSAIESIVAKYKGKTKVSESRIYEVNPTDFKPRITAGPPGETYADAVKRSRAAAAPFDQMARQLKSMAPPEKSSTGGTIQQTAKGLTHTSGPNTKAAAPKPSSRTSNFGKKILSKLPGLGAKTASRAGAAALSGPAAGIVGALGALYTVWDVGNMLYDAFKDSDNIEGMSDADQAVIKQNLAVVNSFMKDPKVADTLPQDIKTRVENVMADLVKLSVDTGSATPAATQQAATPAATQQAATPAATQQAATPAATQQAATPAAKVAAAVPAVNTVITDIEKLLKKNNFESREPRTLSEQLAHDRDIVDEGLGRIAYRAARRAGQDMYKGIGNNIIAPATTLATKAATLVGLGYGGYKAWEFWREMKAPKAMSAADKAEFERIKADYNKAVPDQATFDALPKPVQEKLIDLADRLVKMEKQSQGNK